MPVQASGCYVLPDTRTVNFCHEIYYFFLSLDNVVMHICQWSSFWASDCCYIVVTVVIVQFSVFDIWTIVILFFMYLSCFFPFISSHLYDNLNCWFLICCCLLDCFQMSSAAGKTPAPGQAVYSASKHALNGYFHSLRSEVRWI